METKMKTLKSKRKKMHSINLPMWNYEEEDLKQAIKDLKDGLCICYDNYKCTSCKKIDKIMGVWEE